jgi:hypothetical protein
MKAGGYYEYKFAVSHEQLTYVRAVLDATLGGSDPYPCGTVDSIYYDTFDNRCLSQCLVGAATKSKFRIRGYGNGSFSQLHLKQKSLSRVDKLKCRIEELKTEHHIAPEWNAIIPDGKNVQTFAAIAGIALGFGQLVPSMRVRYLRFRYRQFDMRITLDTDIQICSFANGLPFAAQGAVLGTHVLEVKTADPRPHLPLFALLKLRASSFSKFKQGAQALNFQI